MSASRGTSGRLSRKRKNEDSSRSQLATALHDITDDFEDISTVFRLPKKSKVEKLLAPARPRGRPPKRSQSSRTLCSNKETRDEDDFSDAASVSTDDKSSQDLVVIEDDNCDLELDESFLKNDEKLCRSCKHIVPVEMFTNHLKECFQKFKLHKNTRTTTETVLSCSSHQESKPEEKESSAAQKKENLQILPCPLCLKPFKSRSQRQSHIKTCGQNKGLSAEKVISAVRLQEKQAEERIQLGLPVVAVQSSNHEEKETATGRGKRRGKNPVKSKDPDLAMAIALSRSVAEEEAEKRASEEEKLLALGLDHIVEEDRKVKPVVLLPYTSDSMKTNNIKEKGRGSRGRRNFHNTVLATRSLADRERIISEKVATILASEALTNMGWKEITTQGGRGRLSKFRDENCTLWSASSCNLEQPIEKYYVADLESHIKPKKAEVGRLLKRLSDIPGRLNVTVMQNINENSDSESDVEEASVLNDYCTQLAMAELLGSQELNSTRANGPTSPNLSSLDDLQGPSSNITLEAASGFWLIHPAETKQDSNNTATAEESEVNTCKVPNTHVDFEKTHESSNSQGISKEDDILAETRAKVIGESEISAKVLCAGDSKPIDGDGVYTFSSNFCSSEASKPVLDADDSRYRTVNEQRALVNSLTCSENEDFVHSESSCGKNNNLLSSFCNVSSPKKMCRISLSGHILSSLHSDEQKEEDLLAQVCGVSKEQKLCSSPESIRGERNVISKAITEEKLVESQDSEILCLLDTTIDKDTKGSQGLPKRLGRSQEKFNLSGEPVGKIFAEENSPDYCSLNSSSFLHRKYNASFQQEARCSRETVEEETLDEIEKLSDSSCDSDRTEIFSIAKGNINKQDSVAWESGHGSSVNQGKENIKQGKSGELTSKSFNCNSGLVSMETTEEKADKREDISADDWNSPLFLEDEVHKDGNESDEGDARTIIYDNNTGDGMFPVPSSDEPCEIICELETTALFQGKEKEVNITSHASKNSCSVNKHHTFSEKSSDFQDENGVTNVPSSLQCVIDMDETRMYINSKTNRHCNDTTVMYQSNMDKCLMRKVVTPQNASEDTSDPEQREGKLGITLPFEEYSKAGETAINQILEAFEETIPSRYLNEANDTILYKNRVSAKDLPNKNSSSLDDTLPEDVMEKLLETTPPKGTTTLDLDETLEYENSSEKNTTVLHKHGDCSASKNTVVIDNNFLMEDDSNYSSEKHESQGVEGDNRSLKDFGTKSNTSNISPKLSGTKESSKINKRSDSMLTRLIYDWGSLLASGEESDVTIITNDGEELNAHSIVLLARCPELYADVKNSKKQLTWNGVSYDGAYIFLAYLYTGDCTIKTKDDPFWMDVFDLALKYKSEELINFLESLYKIGSSPIKEKRLFQKGSESCVSKVLPEKLESTGRMIENTLIGDVGVRRKEPDEINGSLPNSKMKPGKTSTAVRPSQMNSATDNAIPQQTNNEFKKSTNHSILSTPKADRSNRCGPRKVARCLDLSPFDKTLSPTVLYSDENDQVDKLRTNNISSHDELSKSPKKRACSIYGSQSPDLFDSSVLEENVSFITTPAKSPLAVSSPEDTTLKSHSKESVDDLGAGISNSLSSHKKSPNVQNNCNFQCDESSVCSKFGNNLGQSYKSGVLHSQDAYQDKYCTENNCHISEDANAKKENSFDSAKPLNTEDNSNTDETKNGNVIDLTNDSSDESQSSFCAVGDILDDTTISSKTATPTYSQEDMEPLKLMESEESEKEVDEVSRQVKTDDKNEDAGKGNEIAVDIICPSPNSVVSDKDDHEGSRSGRAENNHSYISNVWDDFDDAGFGISVVMPMTPDKDENAENVSCLDLPSLEKEERVVDHTDNERIISNESQSSTFKSTLPMVPPSLSDQKSLDFAVSITDPQNSCRFDQGCTKASSCISSISDDTMAKVAGDMDDSNLWKEEFEPGFEEDEQMVERGCFDKGNMIGYEKMKTPKQKAKTKNMVTPLPNYKEMPSPELQRELKKYGIKPISRKKAIALLEHVYEKTHPLVTDSEADSSYCDTPLQPQPAKTKTGKPKATASLQERLAIKNSKKTKNTDDKPKKNTATKNKNNKVSQVVNIQDKIEEEEEEDSPLNLSQSSSTSNEGSELECVEESMLLGALEDDIAISATQQGCLSSQVVQFIRSDPEFHQKVLLYEPFFVEDLQASLKANGVKCNMRSLLDILDDQCITFRTRQGQRQRQRGRKCKRKSVGTPGKSPKRSKRTNP